MSLQHDILEDLKVIEEDLGTPTFTWGGGTYNLIPSITEFNRQLEKGGFQLVKLMTATVRLYDISEDENFNEVLTSLFPNGIPQPQEIIAYNVDNQNYRVESIKRDPTKAYFRLIAHSTTRGL